MKVLQDSIQNLAKQEFAYQNKFAELSSIVAKDKETLKSILESNLLYTDTLEMLREVSLKCQQETTNKVASILTQIFKYVMQEEGEVVIETDIKRATPVANIYVKQIQGGKEIYVDPKEETGGTLVDLFSVGLRLAGLLLFTPALNKVLVLDEPLKNVSTNETSAQAYRQRMAEFLKMMSTDYGIQMIIISHERTYIDIADKIVTIDQDENKYARVVEG